MKCEREKILARVSVMGGEGEQFCAPRNSGASSGFWTKLIWSIRVGRALPVLSGELA
jgi:hypothetical protein